MQRLNDTNRGAKLADADEAEGSACGRNVVHADAEQFAMVDGGKDVAGRAAANQDTDSSHICPPSPHHPSCRLLSRLAQRAGAGRTCRSACRSS
eukprot:2723460-Pleurochrysis_carterae.AAC.3